MSVTLHGNNKNSQPFFSKMKLVDFDHASTTYRTCIRINLSQALSSLDYKPHKIKEILSNFKEKPTEEKNVKKLYTTVYSYTPTVCGLLEYS